MMSSSSSTSGSSVMMMLEQSLNCLPDDKEKLLLHFKWRSSSSSRSSKLALHSTCRRFCVAVLVLVARRQPTGRHQ
eukprot:3179-Heterococcus_DN1.PRE.5